MNFLNKILNKVSETYRNENEEYDESYYFENHVKFLNSPFSFFVKLYYRYIASFIMAGAANIKKKDKVLDIGCGVGTLVEQFNKLDYKAVGIDVNKKAIENSIYSKECSLVKTTGDLDFPDDYFDLVVSREVLEHIPLNKIDDCIKEWDRVSKGKMVHLIAVKERGDSALNDPAHVNVQTEDWWVDKFKEHGYKTIKHPQRPFLSPFGNQGYLMFIKE